MRVGARLGRTAGMRVLVLGGWSPGPLWDLAARLPDMAIYQPSIPMPPAGLRWLLNPFLAILVLFLFVVHPHAAAAINRLDEGAAASVLSAGLVATSFVLLRLLVGWLVSFAIWDSVRIARAAVRSFEPDLVMGFSWGGGVACWLLAEGGWCGPTLMLAPTVKAMCWVGRLSLPHLPVPSAVHVFHAEHDAFCPQSQHEMLESMGCHVNLCRGDGHALCARGTLDAIVHCLVDIAESRQRRRADDIGATLVGKTGG
eukprot:gnl/TRDRNA2_/TRDRNA2_27702_c0_seq1.p1 gnl/TRDRNA2_/TRDRNA2_27702_c0~~gnl/TRDRNA2_/TRDRNA2_27702_c0_seq1.p1  ORF type:complete len:256 (+),score=32.93 gnl/TRDRNA2_/TRDRNA2_27702_c0_seq1:81-848(+)